MSIKINTKLLPIKAFFFLFNIAIGPIISYMTIIARQKGFSPSVIGYMLTAFHIASTIGKPIFCWIADSFGLRKFMFILMQGVVGVTFFSIYFIPSITNQVLVQSEHNRTEVYFCPKDPKWDKCLDWRIEQFESKIFKCQMSCRPDASMEFEPFEHEITLDMTSLVQNSSCVVVDEWRNNSSSERVEYFWEKMPLKSLTCNVRCEDDFFRGTLADRGFIPDEEVYYHYEFWIFVCLLMTGFVAKAVVFTTGDAICLGILGDKPHLYGRQFVWEPISAGINSLLVGVIIDAISGFSVFKNYTVVYFVCIISISFNMLIASSIKNDQPKETEAIVRDVCKLFKSARYLTYFAWCCLTGLLTGALYNFLFLLLEDLADEIVQMECGTNYIKTLEGTVMFMQCVFSNIPILFLSGHIVKKFGHINCMHFALAGFAIKSFYYSQLTNPWWVLPIEVFDVLTYGLMNAVFVSYACMIAPKGAEATTRGLVGALFEGFGMSVATFFTGSMFEDIGGHKTFMMFGFISLTALVIHVIIHSTLDYYEKKSDEAVQKTETEMELLNKN